MARPVLGVSDSDGVTLTASESASNFPVTNLQLHGTSRRWETLDALGVKSILWSATSPSVWSLLGLMHHNASKYGSFRVRGATGSSSEIDTNPVFDSAPFGPAYWANTEDNQGGGGFVSDAAWTQASFGIEFWLNPFRDGGQSLLRRGLTGNRPSVEVDYDDTIVFRDHPSHTYELRSTTTVEAGTWIHVAAEYDDTTNTARLIINGVEEDTLTGVTGWDSTGTSLLLSATGFENFSGIINEIRFWSVARSAAAVLADFDAKLVGDETNLLGVWGSEAPDDAVWTNRVDGGADISLAAARYIYDGPDHRSRLWATDDLEHRTWRNGFLHEPLGIYSQYTQVDFLDPTNTEGKIRLARAGLCEAIQTTWYPLAGSDFASGADHSIVERSLLGFESGFSQETKSDYRKQWASIQEWEAEQLWKIYQRVGTTGDVFAIADPEATTNGRMNIGLVRFPPTFTIREDHAQHFTANLALRGL